LQSHERVQSKTRKRPQDSLWPIVLTAKDEAALKATASEFASYLKNQRQSALYDLAYNTVFRRDWHDHRLMVYGTTPKNIAKALLNFAGDIPEQLLLETGVALQAPLGPAFIYSGNGSQWQGMGRQLLAEEPIFHKTIQEVDVLFQRHADFSLEEELAGANGEGRYGYTEIAQPALFALQVGITQMLRHRGLQPVAVAGHSVGEIAAAWASGSLTLEDAVTLIYQRSRLQGTTKGQGAMTAIGLGYDAALEVLLELGLSPSLTIAGINSSRGVTIAGSPDLLTQLETTLTKRKIFQKRLDIDYAFHSLAMDPIEVSVRQALAGIRPRRSHIPFFSTVTGNLLDGRELNAEYWWNNIRKPVLFEQAVKGIIEQGTNIFIEVGPRPVLHSYINTCLKDEKTEGRIIATATNGENSPERVWRAYSQTILFGAAFDWNQVFSSPGKFMQLPNYSWQRMRHWHPVTSESIGLLDRSKVHPLLGYALAQHELTWENQLDTKLYPTLSDHVVGNATVYPGTGFSELVLAAAMAWHPGCLADIEGLEIRSPLLLESDHTKLIRLSIDGQDGSVAIKGKDLGGFESWNLHAVARILSEPQEILLQQGCPVLPNRRPDFTGADHEELTRKAGLSYGPAFQCIDYGWVEGDSALTVFKLPESIEAEVETSHLHPAILDCTFQLIIQLLRADVGVYSGLTFIPTRVGRIVYRKSDELPAFAKATLLRRVPHSLTAEFTVFDKSGKVIAVVKDARFRSVLLGKSAGDYLRLLHYQGIPKPHVFNPDSRPLIAFNRIQAAFVKLTKCSGVVRPHRRYAEEVDPLLDILCQQFTREALQGLSTDGRIIRFEEILACKTGRPEIEPFLDHLLQMAEDDQTIARTDEGWKILPNLEEQASAQDIWNSLVADYPDFFAVVHAVGRVGMHLKSILDGSICPEECDLQNTPPAHLTGQVFSRVGKQQVVRTLRQLVTQSLKQLPEGRRLGIIEISEGLPSFALDTCLVMDFNCGDYVFASTSADTLEAAAQLKGRFPRLETRLIDGSTEQGEVSPVSQLVVVTLDFSTPEDAIEALKYARSCLNPGGSLVVIGQHPSRWVDFVFGAARKHWSWSDDGILLSNQCTAQFWQQQLQLLDFSTGGAIELFQDNLAGLYFLLAQPAEGALPAAPSPKTMPRSWVLLADRQGFSARLSDKLANILQTNCDIVVQACPDDTDSLSTLLLETTASYGQLDGIVYLAGLNPEQVSVETEAILEQQVTRCATAADIIQACEATQTNTTCWLITTNGAGDLLPDRNIGENRQVPIIPVDAALWGFGRTLINEASNYTVRLVDLEGPLSIQTAATALDREFEFPDNEQEIILTAQGERYAPRLTIEPNLDGHKEKPKKTSAMTVSLGFQFPGQLNNLRWEATPCKHLADDEIEIDVHATGLNFRDIMYTLGLLPDEAVENGFAGPTLGLEFSGIVRSVGSKTHGFVPGDKVVGFGPSSFGNRVITKEAALCHLPPKISFQAAATIPSTFFTAYYALHHLAHLQPNEKVLIHGAAGGVGIAAIQLAKWLGAEIYATAGSEEKRDFLRLFGVENIYHSRTLSFADEILADTDGEGVDVVLNSLAGEVVNQNLRVLKPFGRFLELGKRDYYENTKIGLRPFRNNISYFGIDADQLMQAHPELTCKLFAEVMTLFKEGVLHPLPYNVFEAEDIVHAFRYMQQARQIGKIVVTYENGISQVHTPSPAIRGKLELRGDAAYLVTGGLGGFGLRTAEWLVSKGARNLILISRSGPVSEVAMNAIDRLREQGVKVHAVSCDVTNKQALADLLAETATVLPPLRGIVHAATVINDGLISNMDAAQIRSVLAPKALGAYHLHELTLKTPLDFFILFSSATTLFGNPGQGNYVAANACLDTLANNRRAAGLAATCVRWGAIEDVGFLARNEKIKDALQGRMGGSALHSAFALDVLESMLVAGRSGLGVMELDWRALSRFLPSADTPKFSEIARSAGDGGSDEESADNIQRMLEELTEDELQAAIIEMLKSEVGEILQVAPDKIDPTRSMYDMGLDSLMGVELVVVLESRFGARLPVMALSQSPTIAKLADRIIEKLTGNDEPDTDSDEKEILTQTKLLASQHGVEVSAGDMANLAEELESREAAVKDRIIN